MRRLRLALLATALLAGAGCARQDTIVVLMVVTVSGTLSNAAALQVTATGPAGPVSRTYPAPGGQPIVFPTTLTAELPASAAAGVAFDVNALAGSTVLATAHKAPQAIPAGASRTIYLQLTCPGNGCTGMLPSSGPDGGTATSPGCGNGVIDPGETCDTAIAAGAPGACPPAGCDDSIACTTDRDVNTSGNPCLALCTHEAITVLQPNDRCCPPGATTATDPDCSPTCNDGVVDPGETCDTAIAAGQPGACPAAADCISTDPCVVAQLISAGTCSAVCLRTAITRQTSGDHCCPPGAFNAVDADCPAACGDGVRGAGETCDVGIPAGQPGSCPVSCDDGDACTRDELHGAGCQASCLNVAITDPISGDGCCPSGATRATDTDCASACGDGLLEPGETCDPKAPGAGACPTACSPSPAACLQTALAGSAADCSSLCVSTAISACGPADGCCPTGCTAATDADCSTTCGDRIVQGGESCDTGIAAGSAGACPRTCDDGDPCTQDWLLSAGTCQAVCVHVPVAVPAAGDGCCPAGADFLADADCAPVCGDGVVEAPVEACDSAIAGSCAQSCLAAGSCTKVVFRGDAASCSAACALTAITACVNGDGCCAPGCTATSDTDCPIVCGDGVVETGESCDRAITAGLRGACAASCDDGDACTVDLTEGSIPDCTRACTHAAVTACLSGDGCCPAGCSAATDADCAPVCNDGRIEAGETCDPPSTCPTTCPDDGDPCTQEQLVGDPQRCTAACRHVPITSCSGTRSDRCCPTSCTAANDSDC